MQLRSIESPMPTARMESLATAGMPGSARGYVRETLPGHLGQGGAETSRSVRAYVVSGKADGLGRASRAGNLETVIGRDDRKRILDTDLNPWRMICALELSTQDGQMFVGTGWLAGPRTIVTAGHCVYDQSTGGWMQSILVSPGRNGHDRPFEAITANRFSSVDRWITNHDPDYDMGCIHLDQPIGERLGWFSVGLLPDDELMRQMVNVSGYPADRGFGTEQYFHANRVLDVSPRRVYYDVDTYGGQSGSPVWIQGADGEAPIVIGIHAYGVDPERRTRGVEANSAPRIIPESFAVIKEWLTKDAWIM